jgi:hypothetical protein
MGYRSDVAMVAVFESKAHADEVMAVYCLHPNVQKYGVADYWKHKVFSDGVTLLYCSMESVKWYESYEDVQAFMHMRTLLDQFDEERGFLWAWGFVRVGEEVNDIEESYEGKDDCAVSYGLYDIACDTVRVVRTVQVNV